MDDKDYYSILGIARSADQATIKVAYRALTKKYHPDTNPNDKSLTDKFAAIAKAHEVLSSPQKKRVYDDQLAGKAKQPSVPLSSKTSSTINHILNSLEDLEF